MQFTLDVGCEIACGVGARSVGGRNIQYIIRGQDGSIKFLESLDDSVTDDDVVCEERRRTHLCRTNHDKGTRAVFPRCYRARFWFDCIPHPQTSEHTKGAKHYEIHDIVTSLQNDDRLYMRKSWTLEMVSKNCGVQILKLDVRVWELMSRCDADATTMPDNMGLLCMHCVQDDIVVRKVFTPVLDCRE